MSDKFGIGSGSLTPSATFDRSRVSAAPEEKRTTVEEGTTFKGSMSSTCPIVVKGRIEGDVAAPSLNVSASGSVHGKVKVTELRSAGELSGEFDADVVQLSGRVRDKTVIRGKSLEVKLAPPNGKMELVFGECTLDIGDPPAKDEGTKRQGAGASVPPSPTSGPSLADTKEERAKKGKPVDKSITDTDEQKSIVGEK